MPAPSTVLYRRDLLGRLVAAGTGPEPKAHGAWSYRGEGALATETLKAGGTAEVARSFRYDGLGRPVSIDEPAMTLDVSYRSDGDASKPYVDGNIAAETVTYKPAGFPAGTVPPGSMTTCTYDAFGRLTMARSAQRPDLNVDAVYDGNGNLTRLAQAGTSRGCDYHDGTSRLASVAGQAYTHDATGAVTNAGGTSLVRDPASGQMHRGTKGGQSIAVLRDGRGRVVLTMQGTARRLTLRDGAGAVLWEKDGAAPASMQVHGATGRIGLWTGSATYAVSKDLRRSIRILYGGDGKAAAWLSYCAYGALDTAASSIGTLTASARQRYTGQDWIEPLALYDYGTRLYDPTLGRFLSPDPADETPSPYMYVAGDPVNAVDPDGLGKIIITHLVTLPTKKGVRIAYIDQDGVVLFTSACDLEDTLRNKVERYNSSLRSFFGRKGTLPSDDDNFPATSFRTTSGRTFDVDQEKWKRLTDNAVPFEQLDERDQDKLLLKSNRGADFTKNSRIVDIRLSHLKKEWSILPQAAMIKRPAPAPFNAAATAKRRLSADPMPFQPLIGPRIPGSSVASQSRGIAPRSPLAPRANGPPPARLIRSIFKPYPRRSGNEALRLMALEWLHSPPKQQFWEESYSFFPSKD